MAKEALDKSACQNAPERRCICCRSNGSRNGLVRFAVFQGTLCFDLRGKLPGRGYYVCASRECLQKAFMGQLKRQTKLDPAVVAPDAETFVREVLLPGLHKRYSEILLAGFQGHQLLVGADSVEDAAKEGRLAAYVIATDASDATRRKYTANAERKGIGCFGLLDRGAFGRLFGKSDKVVLGWMSGRLLDVFTEVEEAIRRLGGNDL